MTPPPRRIGLLLLFLTAVGASDEPVSAQEEPGAPDARGNPHGPLPPDLDCSTCHTDRAWTPLRPDPDFRHGAATGFPLEAAHEKVDCRGCHLELRFDELRVDADDCGACHVDVHLGSLSPDCRACHEPTSFRDVSVLRVHAWVGFPLTGAHLGVSCASCHESDRLGAFAGEDPTCASCHLQDFREAATVDHVAAGFPTDCRGCHGTFAWGEAAAFDHRAASGGYPLEEVHRLIRCQSCHTVPDLALRFQPAGPTDCVACHQDDFDREHAGTGFPVTCLQCHDQRSWEGGVFEGHDALFPVNSGTHAGVWGDCTQCHPPPSGFAGFTCLSCHEHRQSEMDDKHDDVPGYVYESGGCLSCHPTGREEG